MSAYAENTSVSPEKSQADIAGLLRRYGATGYSYGWDGDRSAVMFRAHERLVRFTVPMPDPTERRFTQTDTGRARRDPEAAYEAEVRRRWRALVLVIKAKLEAVASEVTTFEEEFMAHIVLPGGATVAETIAERIEEAYRSGIDVALLPGTRPALPGGSQ